jgi:hypothetical protein
MGLSLPERERFLSLSRNFLVRRKRPSIRRVLIHVISFLIQIIANKRLKSRSFGYISIFLNMTFGTENPAFSFFNVLFENRQTSI